MVSHQSSGDSDTPRARQLALPLVIATATERTASGSGPSAREHSDGRTGEGEEGSRGSHSHNAFSDAPWAAKDAGSTEHAGNIADAEQSVRDTEQPRPTSEADGEPQQPREAGAGNLPFEPPRGEAHYRPVSPNAPGPASQTPVRGEILRLAQRVSGRRGYHVKANDPLYWGLAAIVTPQMAHIANKMKLRESTSLSAIARSAGMPVSDLVPLLEEMAARGILTCTWDSDTGERRWVLPLAAPDIASAAVSNQRQLIDHPELGTFYERSSLLPYLKIGPLVPPGGAGMGMRVIPVERAIYNISQAQETERLSHWLDAYDGQYALGPCSCRLAEAVRGSGVPDDPRDWRIGLGDEARRMVETHMGRPATRDEVIDVLTHAEENGFVHQVTNLDGPDKISAICNCNRDTCYWLRSSQVFGTPNLSRSAYVASVSPDACAACGACVDVCPSGALRLGQRLDRADGTPVRYPCRDLPDTQSWGPEKWNLRYRDTNRIECHSTGTSPCLTACPAHVPVEAFLRKACEGDFDQAIALIKQANPFPSVCGRICRKPCEDACVREGVDAPLAIREVERYVADHDLTKGRAYVPPKTIASMRGSFPEKVAIIGAGPAGLSCAYHLALAGYHPVVFERRERPGGMLTYGIPSYRLDKRVVAAEIDAIQSLGVEIRCGVDVGRDPSLSDLRQQGFSAFFVAVGCQETHRLGIPGEEAAHVMSALHLLGDVARALSAQSAGDSEEPPLPHLAGTTVIVGSGTMAVAAARAALRCGSSEVHIVSREPKEEAKAGVTLLDHAQSEGVHLSFGWDPASIEVTEGRIRGINLIRHETLRQPGGGAAWRAHARTSSMSFVPCNHVVVAVGRRVEWGSLLKGTKVRIHPDSTISADLQTFQTDEPDVFAGGDVLTGPDTVIGAVAAGREAAISIHRFVQKGSSLVTGRPPRHYVPLDASDVRVPLEEHPGTRVLTGEMWPKVSISGAQRWQDPAPYIDEQAVKDECDRCFACGMTVVDPNACLGCGLCVIRCSFDAIRLNRDIPEAGHMTRFEDRLATMTPHVLARQARLLRRR